MELLKLGVGNAKLNKNTAIFDLPAGHTCPFAKDCAEKVNPKTGKLIPNPNAKFRCFSAVSELISTAARKKRWHNFNLIRNLRTAKQIANLIIASFEANPKALKSTLVRVHSSGDFYNEKYFRAWMIVAKHFSDKTFYAYTKSLKYLVANLNSVPENFHITASRGGKNDNLIEEYNLKNVKVVYSHEEAENLGLAIDHDDSLVYDKNVHSFALLIHGMQAAGSEAMKAVTELKKKGVHGYQRGAKGKGRSTAA
jgi:hypothetical protein